MADTLMSQDEHSKWQEELLKSKKLWVQKGLIGNEADSTMRLGIDFYRGAHWDMDGLGGWRGFSDTDLATVNKIFVVGNTLQGQLAARSPRARVRPRRKSARKSAPLVQSLLNADIGELKFLRQWNRALNDSFYAPHGVVRHGFTSGAEYESKGGRLLTLYGGVKPDRPWLRRVAPWDHLLDWRAESFDPEDGTVGWCAFRNLLFEQDIKENPNLHFRDSLAPFISSEYQNMRPEEDILKDRDADLYELWTVYDARERIWFTITLQDSVVRPIRDKADWPIPWEHLPYNILLVNEQVDSPWCVPIMDEAIPIQIKLNKLRTIMDVIAENTRRIVGYNESQVDDEAAEILKDSGIMEMIPFKGNPKDLIHQLMAGGFPMEILAYHQMLEEDLREATGQSRMDRGQRVNVETAEEAQGIRFGAAVQQSRPQSRFEAFMSDSINLYYQGRRMTMGEDEVVEVLGAGEEEEVQFGEGEQANTIVGGNVDNESQFQPVKQDDLMEEFRLDIQVGSSLPLDQSQEVAKAAANIKVAGTQPQLHRMPELYRRYWVEADIDPSDVMRSLTDAPVRSAAEAPDPDRELDPQDVVNLRGGPPQ